MGVERVVIAVSALSSIGIVPLILLFCSKRNSTFNSTPIVCGMEPVMLLSLKSMRSSDVAAPISSGITPMIKLSRSLILLSEVIAPSVVGIVPSSLLTPNGDSSHQKRHFAVIHSKPSIQENLVMV